MGAGSPAAAAAAAAAAMATGAKFENGENVARSAEVLGCLFFFFVVAWLLFET